jgi:hypothetical protein
MWIKPVSVNIKFHHFPTGMLDEVPVISWSMVVKKTFIISFKAFPWNTEIAQHMRVLDFVVNEHSLLNLGCAKWWKFILPCRATKMIFCWSIWGGWTMSLVAGVLALLSGHSLLMYWWTWSLLFHKKVKQQYLVWPSWSPAKIRTTFNSEQIAHLFSL